MQSLLEAWGREAPCVSAVVCAREPRLFGSEYNREYAGVGEQRKMGVFSSIQSFLPSFPQLEHGEGPGKPRQVVAVAGVPGWRA